MNRRDIKKAHEQSVLRSFKRYLEKDSLVRLPVHRVRP